jgi:hypothetical protein
MGVYCWLNGRAWWLKHRDLPDILHQSKPPTVKFSQLVQDVSIIQPAYAGFDYLGAVLTASRLGIPALND